jgi:hypothetical protein
MSENNKDSEDEKAKIHRVPRLFYTKLAISLQEEFVPNIVVVKEPVVSHKFGAIA